MKLLLLAAIVLIVCVVLFVTGVISPRRSKRMESKVSQVARKAERKSDDKAGRLGDMTRDALQKSRHSAEASARAGRSVNEKITD